MQKIFATVFFFRIMYIFGTMLDSNNEHVPFPVSLKNKY